MNDKLRHDAEAIVRGAIDSVNPSQAVKRALEGQIFAGRVCLVAVGKVLFSYIRKVYGLEQLPNGLHMI